MTTGAMVLGAVPLALSSGAGAESRIQIGWVIVGGLTFGTMLTLYVVPTMYTLMEQGLGKWMGSHHHGTHTASRAHERSGSDSDDWSSSTRRPPVSRSRMVTASSRSVRSRSSAGASPSAAFISMSTPSASATKVRSRCTASTASFSRTSRGSADIVDDLLEFVKNAEVIIHNAEFDIEFLDAELRRIGRSRFTDHCLKVICSLQHAREQHPGKRNSLDALCERYAVSNAHRTLHGACSMPACWPTCFWR